MTESELKQALLDYHERSKHRINRYAPGPGRLDWASQPIPFREFHGAPQVRLPLAADSLLTRYNDVRCGKLPPASEFNVTNLAILFELSLGLSAWKSYDGIDKWALRCNPSSGNLHPTEGYVLCPPLIGLPGGVYHYLSRDHVLERRTTVDDPRWAAAFAGSGILIGLSSIHWREAWKYGMRAWRYCQQDCGHAIAAVGYAAAALGWQTRLIFSAADDEVAALLGLDRQGNFRSAAAAAAEKEAPDALLWVGDPDARPDLEHLLQILPGNQEDGEWHGHANHLSRAHVPWPDIDSIHRITHKPRTYESHEAAPPHPAHIPLQGNPATDLNFSRIARQRRSAINFDGTTRIPAAAFLNMLTCLMARRNVPPWNALASSPAMVHPVILVHRVTGLKPGLYMLLRNPEILPDMKEAMHAEWLWQKTGPDYLPLYLLRSHDLCDVAKAICCHQNIAADSCFALGMLAQFEAALDEPWRYRHLFWECGMLGHVLYLEAEAAGIRATGIGCFFDDEMHALLGIEDHSWQSLYHFTVGSAVDDPRLSTLPPYDVRAWLPSP
ncbi:MAG: SagB/ThcOx family dehydrogenase [Nitrosospira sp.]